MNVVLQAEESMPVVERLQNVARELSRWETGEDWDGVESSIWRLAPFDSTQLFEANLTLRIEPGWKLATYQHCFAGLVLGESYAVPKDRELPASIDNSASDEPWPEWMSQPEEHVIPANTPISYLEYQLFFHFLYQIEGGCDDLSEWQPIVCDEVEIRGKRHKIGQPDAWQSFLPHVIIENENATITVFSFSPGCRDRFHNQTLSFVNGRQTMRSQATLISGLLKIEDDDDVIPEGSLFDSDWLT